MFNEISNRNLPYNSAANKNPISLLKIRMFGLRGWSLELENENKLLHLAAASPWPHVVTLSQVKQTLYYLHMMTITYVCNRFCCALDIVINKVMS